MLNSTTSMNVIAVESPFFPSMELPITFMSENGPQFVSKEMNEFKKFYAFVHVASSPHYPQSNGLAERTVKTVKYLLENSQDFHLALLTYRATPMPWCGLSPAELLMGRRIRTDVPRVKHLFVPRWPHLNNFRMLDQKHKAEQKRYYDRRHRVRPLAPYPDDSSVWVDTRGRQVPGQIVN